MLWQGNFLSLYIYLLFCYNFNIGGICVQYIIEQEIDIRNSYLIYDDHMELVYLARSNVGWGYALELMRPNGKTVAELRKPHPLAFAAMDIYVKGIKIGRTKLSWSILAKEKYKVSGLDWYVENDSFDWDFDIWSNNHEHLASIKKEFFRATDVRTVTVFEDDNGLNALLVALTLDAFGSKRY
jgi:uncharacterized protein YxjI